MKQEIIEKIKYSIEEYFIKEDMSPSVREISNMTDVPKSTVQRYITYMENEGIITKTDRGIETKRTIKANNAFVSVPKVGSIPCGPLSEEEEHIDEYIKLPRVITGEGEFYLLTASGNSMIEAGIDDGDLVLIKLQNHAKYGDIVVALADGKNTLKRYMPDNEKRVIILHPENKEMEDI
ncbi:MAG: helix-turn-helix domain-containing protein, partial [Clostridia bacterium]|nr:helix-turn-helix domain-containing protein [Clostridia bacterium]